jgi:hypothetical protein
MESTDWSLRVFFQIVEKRRVKAILHAFKHGKMQFQKLLHRVEHAAQRL